MQFVCSALCVPFKCAIFFHQRSMQLCSFSVLSFTFKFQLMKLHYFMPHDESEQRMFNLNPELCFLDVHTFAS